MCDLLFVYLFLSVYVYMLGLFVNRFEKKESGGESGPAKKLKTLGNDIDVPLEKGSETFFQTPLGSILSLPRTILESA